MGFEDYVENIYSGEEFNRLCEKENWQLVKFLSSNDLSKPQEDHYNFHYKIGENSIPEEEVYLSKNNECSKGGLYFTLFPDGQMWEKQHCFKVSIPRDAQVLVESSLKFKTNKLILIEEMPEEFYIKNIRVNPRWLKNINQNSSVCLTAVQQNGWALQYVKKQTPEICLAAVQQHVCALQHVEKQTPEICLAAAQQNVCVLRYVEEQMPKICLAAALLLALSLIDYIINGV